MNCESCAEQAIQPKKKGVIIMRNAIINACTLTVFLYCLLASPKAFAVGTQAETIAATSTATISFSDGSLRFAIVENSSDFSFGIGNNPLPNMGMTYYAQNEEPKAAYLLAVEDLGFLSNEWYVTITLSPFINENNEQFAGIIKLDNQTAANQNASIGTNGLIAAKSVECVSGNSALIMLGDKLLQNGAFRAIWSNISVSLSISDLEVFKIKPEHYTAILTWSLVMGPLY